MRNTQNRKNRVFLAVAAMATIGLMTAACGSGNDGAEADTGQDTDSNAAENQVTHSGTLAEPADAEDAFTYDTELAPVGAELAVEVKPEADASTVVLTVTGLVPDRGYAAHAHTEACGDTGDVAGPHFQHEADPEVDPENPKEAYVNPENEVWLDLTTDAEGNGTSEANVPFALSAEATPKSVVVHKAEKTGTGDGEAGKAGDRVACLTIPSPA